MMTLSRICKLIDSSTGDLPPFPRTEIFNERWLLRSIVDWFSCNDVPGFALTFAPGARWFSEARLPSAFLAHAKGDPLAESWTHADAVIGHFDIGVAGSTDCALRPEAKQFIVAEAKIFSKLSPGVTHAPYFDQAARTVACISELLRHAGRSPDSVDRLAFYVLAPGSQISAGIFASQMDRSSIQGKVQQRVAAYKGLRDAWYHDWFEPTVDRIAVQQISWETVIDHIQLHDPESATEIRDFYGRCLKWNGSNSEKGRG